MKAAVIGPLCRDRNVFAGKSYERPGGVTCYAGAALARLGAETVVFGSFGQEPPGWEPVTGARLVHVAAAGTIEFVNEYDSARGNQRRQRAVYFDNRIEPEDISEADLAGLDYLILGPLFHDNLSRALAERLSAFGKLALAAQGAIRYVEGDRVIWRNSEKVIDLLPLCEYVALDDRELEFIAGTSGVAAGADILRKEGAANLLVTLGSRGSKLFLSNGQYDIRAFPPRRIVDPTGAGDTYLAAYLRAVELYGDPLQRGEFAAMAATISIEGSGPFSGSLEQVEQRLGWG